MWSYFELKDFSFWSIVWFFCKLYVLYKIAYFLTGVFFSAISILRKSKMTEEHSQYVDIATRLQQKEYVTSGFPKPTFTFTQQDIFYLRVIRACAIKSKMIKQHQLAGINLLGSLMSDRELKSLAESYYNQLKERGATFKDIEAGIKYLPDYGYPNINEL